MTSYLSVAVKIISSKRLLGINLSSKEFQVAMVYSMQLLTTK